MLLLLLNAEGSDPIIDSILSESEQHIQDILTYKFFGTEGEDLIANYRNRVIPSVCTWDYSPLIGARCEKGVVTRILVNSPRYPNLDPSYVPHSVTSLSIKFAGLRKQIQTRMLPISLIHLDIQQNKIFGTFDMTSLPRTLESIMGCMNRISGLVHLCSLPPAIKKIDFSDNRLAGDYVYVANIPPSIFWIILRRNPHRGIKPMDGYELDRSKFYIKWKSLNVTDAYRKVQMGLY